MGTLYELLGALPNDDADCLRKAFRKAAKGSHPDTNPGDPGAALRFRQLVRAYEILADSDQRATYNQLLAVALKPPPSTSERVYATMRKFASNTIAATIISGLLIGSYTLFGHFSNESGAAENWIGATARGPLELASLVTAAPPDPAYPSELRSERLAAAVADETIMPAAAATERTEGVQPASSLDAKALLALNEVPPARGSAVSRRNVDAQRPRVAKATVNRGILLFHVGPFNNPYPFAFIDTSRSRVAAQPPSKTPPVKVRAQPRVAAATTP
jgi:hypothetical protein